MRILVVGGTRFVGPPVVRRLSNLGHAVTVYHRGEHEADLPYGVEHLHAPEAAAPIVAYPRALTEMAWDVVLAMFLVGDRDSEALMRTFRGVARRVVALSSGDVYRAYGVLHATGPGPPDPRPLAEEAPLRLRMHPYRDAPGLPAELSGSEKIFVERAVLSDKDLPGTVLRLPAVWGPGDVHGRFAAPWRRIADGRKSIVLGRSYGGWRWTHGYVDDVAEAVTLAVLRERARGKIYNVGEERAPTMAERVESFARAAGRNTRVVLVDDDRLPPHLASGLNFAQDLVYDTARIRADLDWRESTPLAEAFARTAAWEESRRVPDAAAVEAEYAAEDSVLRLTGAPASGPGENPFEAEASSGAGKADS